MKTNERMFLTLFAIAACSFCFGLGQQQVPAAPICTMSCCEPLYSWWTFGTPGGSKCQSAQIPGATFPFAGTDNSNTAVKAVYVPTASGVGCALNPSGTFDRWVWPSNTAGCAPSGGVYPTPETVTVSGTPPTLSAPGVGRNTCIPP